jgi:chemotaxis protein methyltransferase CheR
MTDISDSEFRYFQQFIFERAGISISAAKKALVCGRLGKRLQARELPDYRAYMALLERPDEQAEVQAAVDLLTTNETYFFREPRHFEVLRAQALAPGPRSQPFRVWSAASSTGEEAYTIAMVLADCLASRPFEIVGTDISTRVLEKARQGLYPLERTQGIPPAFLKRYCLRGHGEYEGTLLVERALRERVRFLHANLNQPLPRLGSFDVIFLRNVMIYFSDATKREVVGRVLDTLKPGGVLCIGHSESLHGVSDAVKQLAPSVYRKSDPLSRGAGED